MASNLSRVTTPVISKLQGTSLQNMVVGGSFGYQNSFSTKSNKGSGSKTKPPYTPYGVSFISKDNIPRWTSSRRLKMLSPEDRNEAALSDQAVMLLTKVSRKQLISSAFPDKKASAGKPRSHLGTSTSEECIGSIRSKSHLSPLSQYLTEEKDQKRAPKTSLYDFLDPDKNSDDTK